MQTRHILVMQPWIHQLAHEILYGVIDAVAEDNGRSPIEVIKVPYDWSVLKQGGKRWQCDGLIAAVFNREQFAIAQALKWRCVSTHGGSSWKGLPWVDGDHYATGAMAADYLLGLGFDAFAYVGGENLQALQERRRGYTDRIEAAGKRLGVFGFPTMLMIDGSDRRTWSARLGKLPKPCGVYCSDDATARTLAIFAHSIGLHIPDDLALLGTQNDEGLCRGMASSLSSVHIPYRQVGYQAARLLQRSFKDPAVRNARIKVPPSHVVERASTQALAVSDPNLRQAIRYLREHYADKVSMPEVARQAGLSLRNLQRRFRDHLGHTPQTELQHIRLQQVKELLRETNLTLDDIAQRTGYQSANYLCEHFRRATSQSPGVYRSQNRNRNAPTVTPPVKP